jgi:hypothetical protein
VSLARGDLSPHIIIQSPRLRGGEFESHLQKRLLQQYQPIADLKRLAANVSSRGDAVEKGVEKPSEQ